MGVFFGPPLLIFLFNGAVFRKYIPLRAGCACGKITLSIHPTVSTNQTVSTNSEENVTLTRPIRHLEQPPSLRSWPSILALLFAGFITILLASGGQSVMAAPLPAPLSQSPSTTADLIISEYIDGPGNDRAIEIFNGTGSPVPLAGYVLEVYNSSNGNSGTPYTLDLSLVAPSISTGSTIVVVSAGSSAALQSFYQWDELLFDGNDAIVLRNEGVTGENIVDSFGQLGSVPASGAWTDNGVTTKSTDLRRKPDVCTGRVNATDPFAPALQWNQYLNTDYTNLGVHSVVCIQPVINEFVFNHYGSNSHEYIEIRFRAPITYDAYTVLVINGNEGTDVGRITNVFPVFDSAIPSSGYWTTGFLYDQIDNGTNTILLVRSFTGTVGDDIDTNNDGAIDVQPWLQRVDYVAVSLGRPGDKTYAEGVVLTPYFDGKPGMPGGASRIPNDQQNTYQISNWTRNYFNGEGLSCAGCQPGTPFDEAVNTPGQPNRLGTGTPTPTGTITITPTWTPTITRTPGTLPANCMNVIINGGFEQNHEGWKFGDDPVVPRYASDQRSEGLRSVLLGNPPGAGTTNVVSYSSVRQLVKIPPDATVAYLTWDHYSLTQEPVSTDPSNRSDRQEMIALAPNQMPITIKYRERLNETGWTSERVELTELIGKNFYVYFNVYNDGNGKRTWMYLDNVELVVCYPLNVTPGAWMSTPTAIPLPTLLPPHTATSTATGTATATATSTATPTATGTITDTDPITSTPTLTETVTTTPTATSTPTETVLSRSGAGARSVGTPYPPENSSVAGCVELVINGDFETESDGWIFPLTSAGYTEDITYGDSKRAIRIGSLGSPDVADIGIAEQLIDLPKGYERIILEFRYYPITDPDPGPGDLQYVDIYNYYTEQFEDRVLSVQRSDKRWLQQQSDLSDLSGQRIRLRFAVNNDGVAGRSAMYIDNVSVKACGFTGDTAEVDANATATSEAQGGGTGGTSSRNSTAVATLTTPDNGTSGMSGTQTGGVTPTATPSDNSGWMAGWINQLGAIAILAGILVVIALLVWGILYALRPNDPN